GPVTAEPAPYPAGTELGLVGQEQGGRFIELPVRALPAAEGYLDTGAPVVTELDVADSLAVVGPCRAGLAVPGDQLPGDDRGLSLGEDSRLRRADAGDVSDCVDVRVSGFESQRVDRDPAVDAHPGLGDNRGYQVDWHAKEQVERHLLAVGEDGYPALRIQASHQPVRVPADSPLREFRQKRLRCRRQRSPARRGRQRRRRRCRTRGRL